MAGGPPGKRERRWIRRRREDGMASHAARRPSRTSDVTDSVATAAVEVKRES